MWELWEAEGEAHWKRASECCQIDLKKKKQRKDLQLLNRQFLIHQVEKTLLEYGSRDINCLYQNVGKVKVWGGLRIMPDVKWSYFLMPCR